MFGQKDISPIKLYCHLSGTTEIVLMIFGVIGSLGAGVAGPLMTLLFGDMINDFAGTSGTTIDQTIATNWNMIMAQFKDTVAKMVKKLIIIGFSMLVANFLMTFMWSYSALRQMHHLKEKYFAIILKQEQGWFDQNNAFEFATKVQAQLEQIELGIGDKFGVVLLMVAQIVAGLVIAFSTSWKLTLVMLCVTPFICACIMYLVTALKRTIVLARKTYEKAGGVAEEMLYNIKTVASFTNFEFEIERFGKFIDKVHEYDKEKAYKLGISIAGIIFFIVVTFVIALIYGRVLIYNYETNSNTGEPFSSGDVLKVIFSTLMAMMSIGSIAPN